MWYFSWILGLPLAAGFAVLNAMWFEMMDDRDKGHAQHAAQQRDQ